VPQVAPEACERELESLDGSTNGGKSYIQEPEQTIVIPAFLVGRTVTVICYRDKKAWEEVTGKPGLRG
jgi:hypothetical protein